MRLLAQLADLGVGQRAVGRAEAQREREAAAAGTERVGAELVERRGRPRAASPAAARSVAHDVGRGHRVVDARTRGRCVDAGKRDGAPERRGRAAAPSSSASSVELEGDHRRVEPERVEHRRARPRRPRRRRAPSTSDPRGRARRGSRRATPGSSATSSMLERVEHDVRPRRPRRRRRPGGRPRPGDGGRVPASASATCSGSSGSRPPPARSAARNTRPISNSATSARPCAAVARDRAQQAGQDRGAQHRLLGAQRVRRRARSRSTGAPARSRSAGATSGSVIASEQPAPDQRVGDQPALPLARA